jgi:hypothetical protein
MMSTASRRASPKTGEQRSLRKIAEMLAAEGHVNELGQPYNARAIWAMLGGKRRKAPQQTTTKAVGSS